MGECDEKKGGVVPCKFFDEPWLYPPVEEKLRKKLEREAERNEHALATSEEDDDDDDETWVRNMQQQVRADVRARRDWDEGNGVVPVNCVTLVCEK